MLVLRQAPLSSITLNIYMKGKESKKIKLLKVGFILSNKNEKLVSSNKSQVKMDGKAQAKEIDQNELKLQQQNSSDVGIQQEPPCGPINRLIDFSAGVDFPVGLTPNFQEFRFIYNANELRYIIEDCEQTLQTECGPVTVPLFQVRVVGCIPWLTSAQVTGQCGGLEPDTGGCPPVFDNSNYAHASISGTVCVDTIIGCCTTMPTNLPSLDCINVTLSGVQLYDGVFAGQCGRNTLSNGYFVSGTFQLPSITCP